MGTPDNGDNLDLPPRGLGTALVDLAPFVTPFPSAQPSHAFCRLFINRMLGVDGTAY